MSDILSQLKKKDVSKLKLKNGNSVEKELKHHAAILANCITEELSNVYDSYSPSVYCRSYGLYNSIYIDDTQIEILAKGLTMSIGVKFDEGAIHKGFFGEDANVAVLLNEGWQTHGSFANVPYLGYRNATHFIENGIEKYKSKVNKPFAVKFTINDEIRTF